jgi:hypothetical protein
VGVYKIPQFPLDITISNMGTYLQGQEGKDNVTPKPAPNGQKTSDLKMQNQPSFSILKENT